MTREISSVDGEPEVTETPFVQVRESVPPVWLEQGGGAGVGDGLGLGLGLLGDGLGDGEGDGGGTAAACAA